MNSKPTIETDMNEKERLTVAVASCFKPKVFDRIGFIENILMKEV